MLNVSMKLEVINFYKLSNLKFNGTFIFGYQDYSSFNVFWTGIYDLGEVDSTVHHEIYNNELESFYYYIDLHETFHEGQSIQDYYDIFEFGRLDGPAIYDNIFTKSYRTNTINTEFKRSKNRLYRSYEGRKDRELHFLDIKVHFSYFVRNSLLS